MRSVTANGRKVRRFQAGYAVVLAALSALAAPARADTLPVAITETSCGADPNGVFQRVVDPTGCVLATALGSLTLSPFVSLSVQISTLGVFLNGVHGGGATAVVRYFFEVTGGNSGDVVPLLIATNLSTAGTPESGGHSFASLSAFTNSFGTSSVAVCTNESCGTTDSSFLGILSTRARSGEVGELDLQVSVGSGPSLNSGFASASADPFIYVDPSFSAASQYSILVSPGVGNGIASASVPEPGSAGLLALPAGLLLWIAARRRTFARPAE
jgi:hypothetical protein